MAENTAKQIADAADGAAVGEGSVVGTDDRGRTGPDGPSDQSGLGERPRRRRLSNLNVTEAPPVLDDPDAAGPAGIGLVLRRQREAYGLSVRDVAQQLRIRAVQLEALEDGRIEDLPGTVYCIGYVRSYADYLGLDGEVAVQRFKEVAGSLGKDGKLVFPVPHRESKLPRPALAVGVLALLAAGYGIWAIALEPTGPALVADVPAHLSSGPVTATTPDTPAPAPAAAPASTAPAAVPTPPPVAEAALAVAADDTGVTAAATTAAAPETSEPATLAQDIADPDTGASEAEALTAIEVPAPEIQAVERLVDPALPDPDGPIAAAPEVAEAPATEAIEDTRPALSVVAATAQAAEVAGTEPAFARPPVALGAVGEARVVLRALDDAYVQIKGTGDAVLLSRVLRTGDTYHVPDQAGLRLVTGNAGALEVTVDGRAAPVLGAEGAIVEGIEMSPERLLAGGTN